MSSLHPIISLQNFWWHFSSFENVVVRDVHRNWNFPNINVTNANRRAGRIRTKRATTTTQCGSRRRLCCQFHSFAAIRQKTSDLWWFPNRGQVLVKVVRRRAYTGGCLSCADNNCQKISTNFFGIKETRALSEFMVLVISWSKYWLTDSSNFHSIYLPRRKQLIHTSK